MYDTVSGAFSRKLWFGTDSTSDNSWPVALKFMSIGASHIKDNKQIVLTLDHDVQNKSELNLKKYRQIEEFAKQQKVDFYPAGRGIGHQIMVEEGYAWPGVSKTRPHQTTFPHQYLRLSVSPRTATRTRTEVLDALAQRL